MIVASTSAVALLARMKMRSRAHIANSPASGLALAKYPVADLHTFL
jgi:hypothetical protein